MVFNGKMDVAVMIWERAQTLSQDFQIFNLSEPALIPLIPIKTAWQTPPAGYIKVNVDAAVSNGCSGFAAVARDDDGFVLGGCYKFRNEELEASWAELEALTVGIKLAKKLKANQVILESDSATLVNKVNKWTQDITILGQRVPGSAPTIHSGGAPASHHSGAPVSHREISKTMLQLVPVPSLLNHSGPSPFGTRASGTLGPWSCQSIGTLGNLGRRWCGSIGTLLLGRARALDAISNLGRWSCGSLGHHRHLGAWMYGSLVHHRQPRPLVVRKPRYHR
ncbi:hypothetical protein PVK06_026610 [Gossypium arboreum]|uniref:RNase H type-1 domain-containing protein n=1 Tax=Gossypium arboreum TaxID=29729 RepID=A0ABR0NYN9_GOSAR|nr:hypothetical protein PVK06_026610 [Gossypium arboreum]